MEHNEHTIPVGDVTFLFVTHQDFKGGLSTLSTIHMEDKYFDGCVANNNL